MWYTLHLMAAKGQLEELMRMLIFLSENMHCGECRGHLKAFLSRTAHIWKRVHDAERALYYTWYLHQLVNKRTHKENMSFEDVKEFYLHYDETSTECNNVCTEQS